MSDRYAQIVNSLPGKLIASRIGLPRPATLHRLPLGVEQIRGPAIAGPVLLGAAPGGSLSGALKRALQETGATIVDDAAGGETAAGGTAMGGIAMGGAAGGAAPVNALVYDATGIADSAQLVELQRFFHPNVRRVATSGRIVVLGTRPHASIVGRLQGTSARKPSHSSKQSGGDLHAGADPRGAAASPPLPEDLRRHIAHATAQRALQGFTRSLGKEVGRGITVQLVLVAPGAEDQIDSTLRFLLSARSAYVSGQVIEVGAPVNEAPEIDWERPLAGTVALVTGAARGIGEAIASVLHRDGAQLLLVDVPAAASALASVAGRLGAETIELDITDRDAPQRIVDALSRATGAKMDSSARAGARSGARPKDDEAEGDEHARSRNIPVVVHNAGVTKDRTIAKMPEDRWSTLMEINLTSQERIDEQLLESGLLAANGRIVCVSSLSGIAGNAGQTNYAASKAGVIGHVKALAPILAARGATMNAVAPGFIETQMTAKMPIALREAGRRMNSMSQGGLPLDVAETVAWLACPASTGVNGNVVRVCGQSLLGA